MAGKYKLLRVYYHVCRVTGSCLCFFFFFFFFMRCGKKNNVGSLLGGEITEGFMGARWVLKASLLGLGTISAIQFKRLYLISDSVLSICVESEDFFF